MSNVIDFVAKLKEKRKREQPIPFDFTMNKFEYDNTFTITMNDLNISDLNNEFGYIYVTVPDEDRSDE